LIAFLFGGGDARMGKREMPKSLEELMDEKQKAEAELTYWTHKEKILRNQIKDLTRKERTHRLCVRAGMLESFLEKPDLLSDAQVKELLKVAFRQPEVVHTLRKMLENESNLKDPLE
jgi:hypothetical protein